MAEPRTDRSEVEDNWRVREARKRAEKAEARVAELEADLKDYGRRIVKVNDRLVRADAERLSPKTRTWAIQALGYYRESRVKRFRKLAADAGSSYNINAQARAVLVAIDEAMAELKGYR